MVEKRADGSARPSNRGERLAGQIALLVLAVVALVISTLLALFVDRPMQSEEPPLFNPPYEYAHTGHVAFPDYAFFWGPKLFHYLAIHPPVHYVFVGMALRLDLGIRVAEALPILVTMLIVFVIAFFSGLSLAVRIAAIFACAATAVFATTYFGDSSFAARPELHLAVTWLGALLALETGRRRRWNPLWLFFGAGMLTLASAMQWFATMLWIGAAVYAAAAVRSLGWRRARIPIAALGAGVAIFGIPYIVFSLLPTWDILQQLRGFGWNGGFVGLWRQNYDVYRGLRASLGHPQGANVLTSGLPALALLTRLPPFLVAEACLLARRETRLLALAAAPGFAWMFLFTLYKGYDFLPEALVVTFALSALLVAAVLRSAELLGRRAAIAAAGVVVASGLAAAIVVGAPATAHTTFRYGALPTPLEVARAASLEIVGPDALITSQHQLWYMSGARFWRDFTHDVQDRYNVDPTAYFDRYDYVADVPFLSFDPEALHDAPRATVVFAEYATRKLSIAGFFADTESYGLTIFRPRKGHPVVGFVRDGRTLYEFDQAARGGTEFVSAICPYRGAGTAAQQLSIRDERGGLHVRFPISQAYAELPPLTKPNAPFPKSPAPLHSITGFVLPHAQWRAQGIGIAGAGCQARDAVRGRVTELDAYTVGNRLTGSRRLVTIYESADEAVAARQATSR